MSRQNFDSMHYLSQQQRFEELCGSEFDADAVEIHDHVCRATIVYTLVGTNQVLELLVDDDNELVMSPRPVLIKKKQGEIKVLAGAYAVSIELNPGPTIADAEIADLNRIAEVMSDMHYYARTDNDRYRWRFLGSNIITSRAGMSAANVTASGALLFRPPIVRGDAPFVFPSLRMYLPGELTREFIQYDGSLWAGTPTVGANFNIKRVMHMFVAPAKK